VGRKLQSSFEQEWVWKLLLDYPVPKDSLPFIERVRAAQKYKAGLSGQLALMLLLSDKPS
jgi:hypothetical protein